MCIRDRLKGDEYYHILTHAELYIKAFNFGKYPPKMHPPTTYSNPISTLFHKSVDGDMYFVEGLTVGSEFGFPRTETKKKYKWSVLQLIIGRRCISLLTCLKAIPSSPTLLPLPCNVRGLSLTSCKKCRVFECTQCYCKINVLHLEITFRQPAVAKQRDGADSLPLAEGSVRRQRLGQVEAGSRQCKQLARYSKESQIRNPTRTQPETPYHRKCGRRGIGAGEWDRVEATGSAAGEHGERKGVGRTLEQVQKTDQADSWTHGREVPGPVQDAAGRCVMRV
eukprot:TRINITY_DN9056_c0_g1_i13.p1 TRINITY_DN9056_c0_g1~~TRINITY_DN9056_c0_g1_i13.p1  ORF type:complete len:280 (+),score=-15.15 TRINITY_DN9056_c0_g1_i13:73-912(+)